MTTIDPQRLERLGPAETILQALTSHADHIYHGRPGMVRSAPNAVGVEWIPVTWKLEPVGPDGWKGSFATDGQAKHVYKLEKQGRRTAKVFVGLLGTDNAIYDSATNLVGHYRPPGLFPEVVRYLYRKIADVWQMDNEFAARWTSWAAAQDHRDLRALLAAFMLVQSRRGDPVRGEGGRVEFFDDDFRDVGEALCLGRQTDPKQLRRIGQILAIHEVVLINNQLGFDRGRHAFLGRYPKVVTKWLRHREENPKLLQSVVKAGFRRLVRDLARSVGYKPQSERFFEALGWKQSQAKDGRRQIAIGKTFAPAETWGGLTEREICERIVKDRPNYKRIVGMLPGGIGLTPAVVAAAVEAGCLSDADLVVATPTLEDLGLLQSGLVAERWKKATQAANDQRAANIARRVRTDEAKAGLQQAVDAATTKAMEQVTRGLRVYVFIDISGSMQHSIEQAKACLTKFVGGIPLDRLHVAVFNTQGREVTIRAASAAGVEHAFRGFAAGGGTSYASGVAVLSNYKPQADEDVLFLFVGDEGEYSPSLLVQTVQASMLRPLAFGLLKVPGESGTVVQDAAQDLGIPCFAIDVSLFGDPYAVTRTLRNLIAATPVSAHRGPAPASARKSLVQQVLETPLLQKPVWA